MLGWKNRANSQQQDETKSAVATSYSIYRVVLAYQTPERAKFITKHKTLLQLQYQMICNS